jgi:predicted RNA-binding protein with PUA-like domain
MKNARQKYWLMKSEPEVYSLLHLQKDQRTLWTGVRNYQARNFMMNDMQIGDQILFYHSNAEPAGIAGLARVSGLAVADPTALDKKSDGFDPKSSKEKPIWFCVEVEFVKAFSNLVSLAQLKSEKALNELLVVQRGQRLSVQPVSEKHFHFILKMES